MDVKKILTNNDWDTIVGYMDDDIREELHTALAPCNNEEFLMAYLNRDRDFLERYKYDLNL